MIEWFSPSRWLLVGAFILATVLGYNMWANHQQEIGEERATVGYNVAIGKQKVIAAALLAAETKKVQMTEKALIDFKNNQEKLDAKNIQTVAGLSARLRTFSGPAGRLRDPNAERCGRGSDGTQSGAATGAVDRGADSTEASGLFSAGATELLTRLTREADDINAAYISCRADSGSLRNILGGM